MSPLQASGCNCCRPSFIDAQEKLKLLTFASCAEPSQAKPSQTRLNWAWLWCKCKIEIQTLARSHLTRFKQSHGALIAANLNKMSGCRLWHQASSVSVMATELSGEIKVSLCPGIVENPNKHTSQKLHDIQGPCHNQHWESNQPLIGCNTSRYRSPSAAGGHFTCAEWDAFDRALQLNTVWSRRVNRLRKQQWRGGN